MDDGREVMKKMITNIRVSRLRIEFEVEGTDGEVKLEGKNYNNIRPLATDEAVYEAATVIAGLQSYPVHQIERRNDKSLVKLAE